MVILSYLSIYRSGDLETVELSEDTVNPGQPKTRPQDFELLKLLGKGGYGKVRFCCFTTLCFSFGKKHFMQIYSRVMLLWLFTRVFMKHMDPVF